MLFKSVLRFTCALFAGLHLSMSVQAAPLGANLAGVSDWSTEWPFVDIFKTARPWISQQTPYGVWDTKETIATNSLGWPTSLNANRGAGTLVAVNAGMPGGDYTILYEGSGTLNVSAGPGLSIKSRTAGKIVVSVEQNQQIHLRIDRTPISNIRVIMPGYENSHTTTTFNSLFLQRLKPYKVLRFMDWGRTNNSKVVRWSDRTLPTNYTQAMPNGVAVEYMIQLANTTKKDMWINIPHMANDEYVLQLATMLRQKLDPSLKVYVEYSNEVWNSMFSQAGYATQMGTSQQLSTNPFQANLRFYSQRSVQIFNIFRTVYGSEMPNRVVRVLATQMIPWAVNEISTWKDAYKSADAIAIAPYFGYHYSSNEERASTLAMTANQVLDKLPQDVQSTMSTVAQIKQVANKFNLRLISYESGQHLVDFNSPDQERVATLFTQVNRSQRMKSIYDNYYMNWESISNDLMMVYSSVGRCSKWGCWGVLETQDQLESQAPKYQSILQYTKSASSGTPAPAPVPVPDNACSTQ